MTTRWEFPIRFKLLALMSVLILASTVAYLSLAIRLFNDDKISLVYELNASTVKTLAAQTDAYLMKIADKIRLLTQGHQDAEWVKAVFEAEPELISYTLYKPTDRAEQWDAVFNVRNAEYQKLYGASDLIRAKSPVPFAKVLAERSWVQNSTLPEAEGTRGVPLLTLAMALDLVGGAHAGVAPGRYVAVADIRTDRILKLLADRGVAQVYVVNSDGEVIAHPDPALVSSRARLSDVPIVRSAADSTVAFQLKPFDWKGRKWLGAYAAVGIGGLHVISQVEEAHAFEASHRLVQKSVLFALIVITAGALISAWFSRSLTGPIRRLVEATEKLSRWEESSIYVNSRDEIGRLARSFNAMSIDLRRQRDQIDRHREDLEIKVKERTAALETQKKQVSEAQDALIRTTRLASLGELAGAAAHEVLNPLNNMNIRVEKIRDQLGTEEMNDFRVLGEISGAWSESFGKSGWEGFEKEVKRESQDAGKTLFEEDLENLRSIATDAAMRRAERTEDMNFITLEITRVAKIVNKMRALSRVGGERKQLDVHLALDETALALADLFEKKKVALVKDFGGETRDFYTLVGDKDELVQVFSNLIRNSLYAIEAAQRRAGEIRIATRRNGSRIEVRIIDNGTGIAPAHLPKLFEASFTTKSLAEGTGLGLSISRRLVRAFDGDIELEKTVEGEGTTFLVWFPGAAT